MPSDLEPCQNVWLWDLLMPCSGGAVSQCSKSSPMPRSPTSEQGLWDKEFHIEITQNQKWTVEYNLVLSCDDYMTSDGVHGPVFLLGHSLSWKKYLNRKNTCWTRELGLQFYDIIKSQLCDWGAMICKYNEDIYISIISAGTEVIRSVVLKPKYNSMPKYHHGTCTMVVLRHLPMVRSYSSDFTHFDLK